MKLNRIPRIVVLVVALLWLAHISAHVFQAQRLVEEVRALDTRVTTVERERAQAAVMIENRLTRIETQLTTLNETAGKAVWGTVGIISLVVIQALLGLVIRKPKTE